jgi:hypothetical protein
MAEQWISAYQAKTIAGSGIALCKRAHAGMVRARAKLLRTTRKRIEDAYVPPIFWWAEGQAALEQDWAIGDFSTWIERSTLIEAFGVTFAASDVLDMLPPERRGVVTRNLSVVGDTAWLSAKDAVDAAVSSGALEPDSAAAAIIQQTRLGFIKARAVEMMPLDADRESRRFPRRRARMGCAIRLLEHRQAVAGLDARPL